MSITYTTVLLSAERLAEIMAKLAEYVAGEKLATGRPLPDNPTPDDFVFPYTRDVMPLLAHVAALTARAEAAERELGALYAHIFQDGGHKQAELTGQTVEETDWLTGQPTGELTPALPGAAIDVMHAWFARGETAEAELAAMRRWHEERMAGFEERALQDCDDESFGNGVYWYLGLNRFERTPQPNSPLARWPQRDDEAAPTQS